MLGSLKIKHLDKNLTKYIQNQKEENYKILMNKIKGLHKWTENPSSWMGLPKDKTSALSKAVIRLREITTQIPVDYFMCINNLILNSLWRGNTLKTANKNLLLLKNNKITA